jgi:hypothetical protein
MTKAADRINHLNSGLMVASLAAAFVLPFELFLFAYAVLGPLHYLTEISWIHDRRYFIDPDKSAPGRRLMAVWLFLVGLTLAVMLYGLVAERLIEDGAPSPVWEIGLFYLVFVSAAVFVFTRSLAAAALAALLTGLGALAFSSSPYYGLVAFLIITIVHVLVFTGAFILFGALKGRSLSGALSLAIFILCVASLFLIVPDRAVAGDFVRKTYAPFEALNTQLIQILGLAPGSALRDIYDSRAGGIAIRLIAFAYTYHYLNWFTKTSVIGWNRISKARAGVILTLWLASIALYASDYMLGFVALYALSVLHVMLELPLNHQSFAGIGRELYGLLRPAQTAPAAAPVPVSRKAARRAQRLRRAKI